jgi:hypothetical protein
MRRRGMRSIDQIYIDGQLVTADGQELLDLYNHIAEMHQCED